MKEANEVSSSGSWKGKRAGSGGAAVVRRVCAFVGGPWSSRIPQCGTFAFGSKRVPQPRFAGAEADLARLKFFSSCVAGPDVYFSGERWEFTHACIVATNTNGACAAGAGYGSSQPRSRARNGRWTLVNYPAVWDGRQKGGMFSKLADVPDVVWRARMVSLRNGYWE